MKPTAKQRAVMEQVIRHFSVSGTLLSAEENHSGIINRTYILTFDDAGHKKMVTLQKMNTYVFKNPEEVMENIQKVTTHLTHKLKERYPLDYERRTLQVLHTKEGGNYFCDDALGCWRMFTFIDHAVAYDRVRSAEDFNRAGLAFGEFQGLLADFPAKTLFETIPDFHNTPKRVQALFASAQEDSAHRAASVSAELEKFHLWESEMQTVHRAIAEGRIPLRVTHNDTKFNNVLLDDQTGDAICVIDLDTVMPGTALFDFGDAIRYGASTAAEDEQDLSKIALDLDLFSAFTSGFVRSAKGLLTEEELHMLPLGALTITKELAARFLKDYLDGDLYFKTAYEGQNLARARAQMALAEDMERKLPQMQQIIADLMNQTA